MSRACEKIQPLLFRVNEGEATPDQAMQVARHLSDCTACRIARARENRLAEMLSSDLEEIVVGEDFVDAVMATLPGDPPKRRRRNRVGKNLRGLKLASFIGFGALLLHPVVPAPGQAGLGPVSATRLLGLDGLPALHEGLPGIAQGAAAAAEVFAGGIAFVAHTAPQGPSLALVGLAAVGALALTAVAALAGASAVVALAVRT